MEGQGQGQLGKFQPGTRVRIKDDVTGPNSGLATYRGRTGRVAGPTPVLGYDLLVEINGVDNGTGNLSFLESELEPVEPDEHVKVLEEAIEGILQAARAGNWDGPELPHTVGAAIARARLIRGLARSERGMPVYERPQPCGAPSGPASSPVPDYLQADG